MLTNLRNPIRMLQKSDLPITTEIPAGQNNFSPGQSCISNSPCSSQSHFFDYHYTPLSTPAKHLVHLSAEVCMTQFSYAKILRVLTFVILDFIPNVEPRIVFKARWRGEDPKQIHLITPNVNF